jgi:hypothetical protein
MAGIASDYPDLDMEPTPRFAPGVRGQLRVEPDMPGHLLHRTVEVSGRSPR